MTEFRRAGPAVDALDKIVTELTAGGNADAEAERARFVEAKKLLEELAPTADKMRRKCEARAELEVVKASILEKLSAGTPEEVLKVAQEIVDEGGDAAEALRPLLDRAHSLEGIATYGTKMVEKVLDLLARLDAITQRFNTEVVPRLSDSVEAAAAEDERKRAKLAAEAASAAELAAKAAEEERLKPVAALMALNEEAARKQREEREREEQKLKAEEEARQRAAAAVAEEAEALRRAEEEGEIRLREVGRDVACGEALAGMLAAPVGAYRAAVEALHSMVAAIAAEPQDLRLRVLRLANEGFQERLGRRPGVWLFLRGVGFEPRERQHLPEGVAAAIGLGPGAAEERFLLLEEPDMFAAFEAWKAWHERLKVVAEVLQALERLAFQRTASLGKHGLDVPAHTVISAAELQRRWEESQSSL